MSMNIKSEEAHRLARELSELTGESITTAVTEALREKVNRLKNKETESLSEKLLAIARSCASHLKGKSLPDHGEFLYDENGLPK